MVPGPSVVTSMERSRHTAATLQDIREALPSAITCTTALFSLFTLPHPSCHFRDTCFRLSCISRCTLAILSLRWVLTDESSLGETDAIKDDWAGHRAEPVAYSGWKETVLALKKEVIPTRPPPVIKAHTILPVGDGDPGVTFPSRPWAHGPCFHKAR